MRSNLLGAALQLHAVRSRGPEVFSVSQFQRNPDPRKIEKPAEVGEVYRDVWELMNMLRSKEMVVY